MLLGKCIDNLKSEAIVDAVGSEPIEDRGNIEYGSKALAGHQGLAAR